MDFDDRNVSRRDFIKKAARTGAGIVFVPFGRSGNARGGHFPLDKSRVVVVGEDTAVDMPDQSINQEAVQVMVDVGIRSLTGIDDVGEAWKSLFPGITGSKKISIKVNCINSLCSSHPEVARGIIDGLTRMQMDGSQFSADNIIIWDRTSGELRNAGYTINESGAGVKCYGTNGRYTGQYDVAGKYQKLSRILTEDCDYMINLSVLKNHGTSGVTLSMKNHYGTCRDPGNLHGNRCDPDIPALNALGPIRDKQVVCICDALFGIISWGPGGPPDVFPKCMIFSQDPVAHDTIGTQMLKEYGTPDYSINRATHIHTASTDSYNLGTDDLNQIDVITIENPTTGLEVQRTVSEPPVRFVLFQNFPNPFNGRTTLSYRLKELASVRLEIVNIHGSLVSRLLNQTQRAGHHRIVWNGTNQKGLLIPTGTYLGLLWVNGTRHTIRMQLVR